MQPQQIEVTPDAVFATIGRLTMENAALRARLAQAEMQLRELLPETPATNGTAEAVPAKSKGG